ncbi:hypothetical protein SASPL_153466 [Salvia splendens]|uniref:Spastin n=1 Tax=Salvia splendens TaxID=180675 RepID=A0A8X8W5I7_SALSN|nr:hypothetical protein SASPL_153466 [Salvia splendens]
MGRQRRHPYTMEMEMEMLSLLSNGRDSNVTFDKFPYYLSEQTRVLLTSAAFVHLKEGDFSKHIRNLSPASRTILLSGHAELYQQMLAKALAHYFEAKLLLLDVTDFSLKMLSKYGGLNTGPGLSIFQKGKSAGMNGLKSEPQAATPKVEPKAATPKEVIPDNEFEKRIRPEVVPASEIGVTFADIGALDEIKESLQELVMLPLRRPDLFEGGLLKPCRGILLSGPPDEVDSMLGQSNRAGEHEAMRKIKNEFMTHWDGLLTKTGEKILVLAATNRPFDLDEAIIRHLDFLELATTTEGYSGSDLKNLCITAAYRPKKKHASEEGKQLSADTEDKKERGITIRPLNMEDFREAKKQVAASFAAEGSVMAELKQWNEAYSEGGSRKKEQLSYFL